MTRFVLNRADVEVARPQGRRMLDVLRADLRLKGTKEGCREGDCGACMVLVGEADGGGARYQAVNSCLLPLGAVEGHHVVTIEGLNGDTLTPVQQAIADEGATQCGFCTPGFVISMTAFLLSAPRLTAEAGCAAVSGNICRCTGYLSLRRAIARLCADLGAGAPAVDDRPGRLAYLVARGVVPAYFLHVAERLGRGRAGGGPPPAPARSRLVVAGATDLLVQRPEDVEQAQIVLLGAREDLRGVRFENGRCVIGGATPVQQLGSSGLMGRLFPETALDLELISSYAIRQRATVAGNIVNASPIGDVSVLLLALDATVHLVSETGRVRERPLREFFLGYKQLDLQAGEILSAVSFPLPPEGARFNFEKVSRRRHLDIASVNTAVQIHAVGGEIRDAHLSAGGVAPVPKHLAGAAALLRGRPLTAATARAAAARAADEVAPISDARGTAAYKRLLLRQLVLAHFIEMFPVPLREELRP